MDGRNLTDTECKLYGKKACALLNMRSCEECPLKGRVADEQILTDLRLFCDLQPEGSVAQLFESKTCTLCKTEPKGKRSCYAIFDMAHTEPKNPPVSMPTYVAMFTAKGPGVLSLTAMKFTMDSSGIQPWTSTSA